MAMGTVVAVVTAAVVIMVVADKEVMAIFKSFLTATPRLTEK